MYCVYIHTNKINGKKYCGVTNDIKRRWRNNGIEYKPPKSESETDRPFWNAIKKYGWDNFEHKIISEFNTKEEAWDEEKRIIKELDLKNRKIGYNVAEGGNGGKVYEVHPRGMKGKPQTEYNKECCRERFTLNNPMHTVVKWGVTHKHPQGMKGKKHSEETKLRIRQKLQGKTFSKERNDKISKTLKGRFFSEDHKSNISKSRKESGIAKGGKNPSAKKVKVIFADGKINLYECGAHCKKDLNISQTIFDKCVKTKEPYVISKGVTQETRKRLEPLVGMKIEYVLENTEITK